CRIHIGPGRAFYTC
nr:Chain P, Cyclic V3 Arch Peptide [synthetic construct]4M1D_Q Chain Q, Cyclic V3 Arch Peptide [synthetic construct]